MAEIIDFERAKAIRDIDRFIANDDDNKLHQAMRKWMKRNAVRGNGYTYDPRTYTQPDD